MIKKIDINYIRKIFPKRNDKSHKGDFGKVIICGGSFSMPGAVYFASVSSLKVGCGLVYIFVPSSIKDNISISLPESIVFSGRGKDFFSLKDVDIFLKLVEDISPDLIVFGPGIGRENKSQNFIIEVIKNIKKPFLLDADGLNAISLSKNISILKEKLAILTPHIGEAKRFFDIDEPKKLAQKLSNETDCIVVLKYFNTIVLDSNNFFILDAPNSGLSKAGSGDILSGLIGGIWAQKGKIYGFDKNSAFEAAVCGVFLHSICGKLSSEKLTPYGVIARDIVDFIPDAIKKIKK
ncbi:MAG: NAD(P)H-hydrate dehydratase [Elusimicrobiales bacterium]|nr:NAD(P)H-hydrate dehydratase [Elusimicrobiales bacterium]